MKILLILITAFCAASIFAQSKTDLAFAKFADEKGVKPAFLEFLADDGVMFNPHQINGKELWKSRADNSPAMLSWYPTFADVSSNGVFGYTTGEGEYRPKGKSDTTVYYSTYATVWRRQPDGNYRAVFDVGISHDKPANSDTNWTSPKTTEKFSGENKPPAANAMSQFYDTAATKGLAKAYKNFTADYVRFLREGKFPILGKSNAPVEIKKSKITFGKGATMQSAGDLGYSITTYEMKSGDKITEKGNIIQIWKLIGGRWQIVLDVFAPITPEQK
jgi:ketosteroid isomerase-like protein